MTERPIRPDYESQTIRITDLAVTSDMIAEKSFSNCLIVGPAMLALLRDLRFDGCQFDIAGDTIESVIFEISGPRWLAGVIGLDRCEFYHCRFTRIGFVLDSAAAANFRNQVAPN